jgi:hypothetical protein
MGVLLQVLIGAAVYSLMGLVWAAMLLAVVGVGAWVVLTLRPQVAHGGHAARVTRRHRHGYEPR